jgi:Spy/CpxP family protein refolding chaperone
MPLLQQLGLSDQQREQVRSLMEDSRPPAGSGQQLRDAELQLHQAIFGDAPNPHAIEAAKTTLEADHAAELDHQIDLLTKIAQILTPDQRQLLMKLEAEGPPAGRGRS